MVLSTWLRAVCLKLESWLGCLSRKTQLCKYPQLSKAFPCLEVNTLVPKPCLGGEPNAVGRQQVKPGESCSFGGVLAQLACMKPWVLSHHTNSDSEALLVLGRLRQEQRCSRASSATEFKASLGCIRKTKT